MSSPRIEADLIVDVLNEAECLSFDIAAADRRHSPGSISLGTAVKRSSMDAGHRGEWSDMHIETLILLMIRWKFLQTLVFGHYEGRSCRLQAWSLRYGPLGYNASDCEARAGPGHRYVSPTQPCTLAQDGVLEKPWCYIDSPLPTLLSNLHLLCRSFTLSLPALLLSYCFRAFLSSHRTSLPHYLIILLHF